MKKAAMITGLISTVMIVFGSLFKIQHWPGAGPLIVFGTMIHVLGFLPLWMIFRVKESQGALSKAVVIIGGITLFLFFISILFKVQHWPGSSPFFLLSFLIGVFGFIPLTLINFKKERERSLWFLPTAFIIVPAIMLVMARNISRVALDSYTTLDNSLGNIPDRIARSSDIFYSDMERMNALNPAKIEPIYTKAFTLKAQSTELRNYIRAVRSNLVMHTEMHPKEVADTLPVSYMYSRDNYDIPTWLMIGSDPSNPSDGEFTAKELKSKITRYRQMIIQLLGDKAGNVSKQIGLSTDDVYMTSYGVIESWETAHFYHLPLGAVLNTLKGFEIDISNAELATIRELSSQAHDALSVTIIEEKEKENP